MVWGQVGIAAGAAIVIYPVVPAVASAYLNEKKAGRSGTLNIASALFSLFLIKLTILYPLSSEALKTMA